MSNYKPIMISMLKRAIPNLIPFDVCITEPLMKPKEPPFKLKIHEISEYEASLPSAIGSRKNFDDTEHCFVCKISPEAAKEKYILSREGYCDPNCECHIGKKERIQSRLNFFDAVNTETEDLWEVDDIWILSGWSGWGVFPKDEEPSYKNMIRRSVLWMS